MKKKDHAYFIQREILRELARTPRGGIERKIGTFNDMLLFFLRKHDIGIDGLHVALCQAYVEEENRIREFIRIQ